MSAEQLQRQQERQASIAQLEENCGELTKTAGLDYPAWLLRAAKAGHLNSQLNYVRDESYLARAAVERPELVRQFVQNAAKFMTESVALGISDNLEPLAVALAESDAEPMPSANWLSMTVDYDPVLARTYMHTYARELKARFASVPLSTDPKTRALELELVNHWTFAGEHRARLDKYDQNLSADQIATSNAAVELLLRDRKRAAAELVSRMSAGDIHLLNGGSRNLSDPRNNSTTRLAEAARMCETNLVSRGND